ncbi:hypothetical protein ACFPVX_15010 [Cohnella faecalis]|uniref:Aldolase n=1 Tax=Cohnella faecalis TaxID=2315694 RepID=A0A398CQS0_9BACL|nr:hypothetical protein [Cohnella faecalis]RIE01771.1 hypothetical protein D3H35_13290 [Cohnella faecalis]
MFYYQAYGLTVASEMELPELAIYPEAAAPDVVIQWGQVERRPSSSWYESFDQAFVLSIAGVGYYEVRAGRTIIVESIQPDRRKTRVFLLGSAFGALLFQRGHIPLHGSALAFSNHAYLFTGQSGAGKSTLAHAFTRRGYALISDDVLATELDARGVAHVCSAYPQQKLWPASLEMFGSTGDGLETIWDGESKYRIPVAASFRAGRFPLKKLFRLSASPDIDKPLIREVSGAQKLQIVLDETYRSFFVAEMGLQSAYFRKITQIAQQLHIYELIRPLEGTHPDELVDLVLAQSNNMSKGNDHAIGRINEH